MSRHDSASTSGADSGQAVTENGQPMRVLIEAEVAALFRRAKEDALSLSLRRAILEYRLEKPWIQRG